MKPIFEHSELIKGEDYYIASEISLEGFEGNVAITVKKSTLIDYVIEEELNYGYRDEPDSLVKLNEPGIYLEENWEHILKQYIKDNLE